MADTKQLVDARKNLTDVLRNKRTTDALKAAATSHLQPEKVLRLALVAIQKTPLLAQCSTESILGALMTTTALGLEPNTPLGHAYLIPYKRRVKTGPGRDDWGDIYEVQFQIGYKGFIALANRSPNLILLTADAIHQNDDFKCYLSSESKTGTFFHFSKELGDRGDLMGSFCFMRTARGEHYADMATILPMSEILKIRSRSETFRALTRNVEGADSAAKKARAQVKLDDTPWVMWEDDMAAKSAIKKHCKQVPLSPEMVIAANLDTIADEGMLDLSVLADPEAAKAAVAGELEPRREEEDDAKPELKKLAAPGGDKGEDKPKDKPKDEPVNDAHDGNDDGPQGYDGDPGPGAEEQTRPAATTSREERASGTTGRKPVNVF